MIQIKKFKEQKRIEVTEILPLLKEVQKEFNVKLGITGSLFHKTVGGDVDLIAWIDNDYEEAIDKALDICLYIKDQSYNIGYGVDIFIPFQKRWYEDFKEHFNTEYNSEEGFPTYSLVQYSYTGIHFGYWLKNLEYDTVDNIYYELITMLEDL